MTLVDVAGTVTELQMAKWANSDEEDDVDDEEEEGAAEERASERARRQPYAVLPLCIIWSRVTSRPRSTLSSSVT